MRAYVSGLVVAIALLAAPQPAAAATCYDTCYQTCSYYTNQWYYDSCYGSWNYGCSYIGDVGHVVTSEDYNTGCYYTYSCLPYQCNAHWCPDPVTPELDQWMVSYNDYTGDWSFDQCATTHGNYRPIAAINTYRTGNGQYDANGVLQPYGYAAGQGTTGWPIRETSQCQRWVNAWSGAHYDWKSDNFISTNCGAYGANWVGPGPTLLQGNYEGSKNKGLWLCLFTTTIYGNGGTWQEYRVLDNCNGGSYIEFLGYARYDQIQQPGQSNGTLGDNGECSAATCVGMCGVDCNGILGVKVYTSACDAHDRCVCNHGNNIWAWDCLGDFAVAAVSFVVAVVETVIQAIINAITHAINAVLDFLFGWL